MRYLLASDLHYSLRQLDWIAEQVDDFDAIVLAGDLLDAVGGPDLNAQIEMFIAYLRRLGEQSIVVANSGNHDLTSRRPDGEKAALWMHEIGPAVVTDGESVSVGPDLVSAYAWWEGDATKAELEAQVRDEAQLDRDGLWIWVYHSPPDDSPTSWSGRRHFGDDLLNSLIERYRPDLVLTGHVHEAPYEPAGSWHDRIGTTTVLNAGRQTASVPAHVVIDSDARTATWSTMASRDAIEF